jgi:hypothetical protein
MCEYINLEYVSAYTTHVFTESIEHGLPKFIISYIAP